MARDLTDEEKQHWLEATGQAKPPKPPKQASPAATEKWRKTKASRASELTPLEPRRAEKLFKPHARVQATIDLHGMTQEEAFATLTHFLMRQVQAGHRHVAIITGKGRSSEGVLRRAVPQWLELPQFRPFVAAITHATPKKGGDGVLHVLLKKHGS
jgi:DNA-nicking Smr family endonuclease